jgi:hypothetical protein
MTYRLDERDASTELTILQEDPRESDDAAETGDEGNPILQALKELVEKG